MKFEQLDKIYDQLSADEKKLWEVNHYAYIFAKAEQYLRVGPQIYAKMDFFGMPGTMNSEGLEALENGCKQIVEEGRGLTPEKAFTGLGISGFYDLMRLFHFQRQIQRAILDHVREENGILDQIDFAHIVEEYSITLYNFVSYEK